MVEGDAKCPLQSMAEQTFSSIVEAYDLGPRILEMRDKNADEQKLTLIIFYCNIGPDGSSGHHMYKILTESSLLNGRATITSFIPLQFVTETEDGKTTVLHSNALAAASDSVRPLRILMKPEDEGWLFQRKS